MKYTEKDLETHIKILVDDRQVNNKIFELVEWIKILRHVSIEHLKNGYCDHAYNLNVLALKLHRELTKTLKTQMKIAQGLSGTMMLIAGMEDENGTISAISESFQINWKYLFRD